jgi:hypothetical protein
MIPILVPVDLSKAKKHTCPSIEEGESYLVLHNGKYYAGKFARTKEGWNVGGLNFSSIYPSGAQFNAPGWNGSLWQGVWRIVDTDLELLAASHATNQEKK